MTFTVGGGTVSLRQAARIADKLGLIGQRRLDWLADRALGGDDELRAMRDRGVVRYGPRPQLRGRP